MITKIKKLLIVSSSSLLLLFSVVAPVSVGAISAAGCGTNIGNNIAEGAGATTGTGDKISCSDTNNSGIAAIAKNVVNIFSFIVGAISVIMIIYGGFRYITSGGSSEGVGAAKSTLIYAIIGLIVVALAQIIVQFVLTQSATAVNGAA